MRAVDNLNLLLPRAPAAYLEHARRVTTFLRLLRDEARAPRAAAVGAGLDAARDEFNQHVRAQARAALLDLLRLHLYAELGSESFLWFGEPEREAHECWSQLEALRDELRDLPRTPAPNERAAGLAARLIAALPALGVDEPALGLWRARLERVTHGPAAAERSFQALLRGPTSPERAEALCGAVECALERGAVRAAQRALAEHAWALPLSARALRLAVWCALLSGDEPAAREAERRAHQPWTGRLPQALVELRASAPQWLACLAGRASAVPPSEAAPEPPPALARADHGDLSELRRRIGACAVAQVELCARNATRVVALDVAPGLRERVREWKRGLEHSGGEWAALERQAILDARPALAHRGLAGAASDTIQRAAVACVAIAPYLDAQGEACGWLRLEWEHHLAPARATLTRLAREFAQRACARTPAAGVERDRAALLGGLDATAVASAPAQGERGGPLPALEVEWQPASEVVEPPAARAFEALVEALGMKTAQRRWWGFDVGPRRLRCVALGGGARVEEAPGRALESVQGSTGAANGAANVAVGGVTSDAPKRGGGDVARVAPTRAAAEWAAPLPSSATGAGGRRGVLRALRTAAMVRYDEPRAELSMHAASASGLVLPLRRHGELCGLLVLESTRRRDFPESLAQRWLERAGDFALQLRVAQFREWHRAKFGVDVHIGHGPQAWIEPFSLAARSSAHVTLCGGRGVGKSVVARWLHFCGPAPEAPLLELSGELPTPDSAVWNSPGTVVLEQLERLSETDQLRLAARLDAPRRGGHARGPRWVVCSSARASDPAIATLVHVDLRQRLERLQLCVPDLAQRRTELAQLLHLLAQRVAQEEGVPAPTFEDDAIALLWRQPWPFNVRDLESFVFKLVLMAPGRSLRADEVERIARRFGHELLRRVNSRAPDEGLVRAALLSTMNLRGTLNKTRASLYLGWDPDTLVARMRDLGLDEHALTRADAHALGAESARDGAAPPSSRELGARESGADSSQLSDAAS